MNSSIFGKSQNTVTVTISSDMTLDTMAYRALNGDRPPFLVPYVIDNINGEVILSYNIDERMSLEKLSKEFSATELFRVYKSIIESLIQCGDWCFNNTNFCQNTNYIFVDWPSQTVKFIYAPVREYTQDVSVTKKMLLQLLNNCQDVSNLDLMKFYRYFSGDQFSFQSFKNLLDTIEIPLRDPSEQSIHNLGTQQPPPPQPVTLQQQTPPPLPPPPPMPSMQEFVMPPEPKQQEEKSKGFFKMFGKKNKKNSGEIYLYDDGQKPQSAMNKISRPQKLPDNFNNMQSDAMLTLVAPNVNFPRLEYQIPLVLINNKFSLGRQDKGNKPKESDYEFDVSIKSISRKHATIVRENDVYYLVDFNSSNGTFLNDERLKRNIQYQLNYNDKISFSKQGIEYWFTTDEDSGDETMLMF